MNGALRRIPETYRIKECARFRERSGLLWNGNRWTTESVAEAQNSLWISFFVAFSDQTQ
jgi:hypothetical protein